jgi:Zn-dependent protease
MSESYRFLIDLAILLSAISLHEFSHAWAAYACGDSTAESAGRLTVNPIAHIDLVGTIGLPVVLWFLGSPVMFGWAKPVPVNFAAFRHPRRDTVLVGFAGVLANLLSAVLFATVLRLKLMPYGTVGHLIVEDALIVNLVLGIFNLVPVPPLDGSRIITGLLPSNLASRYIKIEPAGMLILMLLIFVGLLDRLILPVVNHLAVLLAG